MVAGTPWGTKPDPLEPSWAKPGQAWPTPAPDGQKKELPVQVKRSSFLRDWNLMASRFAETVFLSTQNGIFLQNICSRLRKAIFLE
jgi:hypothetical protein